MALEAGINFIDTANVYGGGTSECIVGQSLKNLDVRREDVVLATKVLGPMSEGPNARGASRGHIMSECKASLQRLQTDYIDLLTALDEVSRLPPEYPGWMLERQGEYRAHMKA